MGWEAGIAQYGSFGQGPEVLSVRRHVHGVLVASGLSDLEKAVSLVEVARSFLCSPRGLREQDPKKG
jgi:hypothetical protein